MIPFNKPYLTGDEVNFLNEAVDTGKISGNGIFTRKCHDFFCEIYGFQKCLLTTSCTDALEMSAILLDIKPGDEVIVPSYTFVSTANAFVLRGARIIFADSYPHHPNIDPAHLDSLITKKTKAIVVVHYGGVSCDMNRIMAIAQSHNIMVIEDAAQSVDSYFNDKVLGSIGTFSAFSFHETKNLSCGEGGMLAINDQKYNDRAEIIWEKGTNRSAFFRGEVSKYNWVDIGSSFLPSELNAAFLFAQLTHLRSIQKKRKELWNNYFAALSHLVDKEHFRFLPIPEYATNNAHVFAIVCNSVKERTNLITYLKSKDILAVFHYQSLHKSPYYKDHHDGGALPNADRFSDCLLRLPLFFNLTSKEQNLIISAVYDFFQAK